DAPRLIKASIVNYSLSKNNLGEEMNLLCGALSTMILVFAMAFDAMADIQWSYSWENQVGQPRSISISIPDELAEKAYVGPGDLLDYDKISGMIFAKTKDLAATLSDHVAFIRVSGHSLKDLTYEGESLEINRPIMNARMEQIRLFLE